MQRFWGLLLASSLGFSALACSERDTSVQLRSLSRSGEISFVCRDTGVLTGKLNGKPLTECLHSSLEGQERDLIALITQTATGEVAVVNVPADPRDPLRGEGVVDVDPSTPSFGFLRVGAQPADIVSTPDGEASFVGAADPERPGLYALPTTCLGAPTPSQSIRDLTTWAACSLTSPPGAMELAFETCSDAECKAKNKEAANSSPSAERECPSNLIARDEGGRWKILVTLPQEGVIAVVDAQALLDREPGSFDACPVDTTHSLLIDLPPDVSSEGSREFGACIAPEPTPAPPAVFAPRPVDLALAGDVLYVADEGAPVIHRLDVSKPSQPTELPPLLPTSLENPARTVVTTRVSVSPLTPTGKRFLYAIDREDAPSSSVMVFDVSPGASARTPLVKDGFENIPGDSPDRLRFGVPVKDVLFIERDDPITNAQGTALLGQACNPNPSEAPGTEYQTTIGVSVVGTQKLRGVFAMVLLSNGVLSVVDVEDFNAPCRRPATLNRESEPDIYGCANDHPESGVEIFAKNGTPTVTNELSCRVVTPHRPRSAFYDMNTAEGGVHGPALRSFPQLGVPDNDLGTTFAQRPKLLAVDFERAGEPVPAQLYVGINLYRRDSPASGTALGVAPATSQRYSLTLPFAEPRAYTTDRYALTYEGVVAGGLTNAILHFVPETNTLTVTDPANGGFCGLGVHDVELMRELGAERFGLEGDELQAFAESHADAFWITGEVPEADDTYWRTRPSCARDECVRAFGDFDAEEPSLARRFSIREANDGQMTLEGAGSALAACCFPPGTAYEIGATAQWVLAGRTTGVRHAIVASPRTLPSGETVLECVRDCDERKRWDEPRVFEITCGPEDVACRTAVGAASPRAGQDPCQLESRDGAEGWAVRLDEPAARCIHASPTARFAVYRGLAGSTRGMSFTWDVSQPFAPLGLDLRSLSQSVTPTRVASLPGLDWLTILDSTTLGLVVVNLDGFQILTPTIN